MLPDHPDRTAALTTYRSTHSRIPADTNDPVVTITLSPEPELPPRRRSLWLCWVGAFGGLTMAATLAALTGVVLLQNLDRSPGG